MKTAVVCGAGGFIGHHLAHLLKREGYWVRGVDLKPQEFAQSPANEFRLSDLRSLENCRQAVLIDGQPADEVYQLAADMGGMGFIHSAECEIMTNSALINIYMVNAASDAGVGRYFFSSSACVYPDQNADDTYITENDAYPAMPDNEYGWEKLYAERMALSFERNRDMRVRIARFQNCYGPNGTWRGGREKAPAAICRKIAIAPDCGTIEVWGDGTALRVYTYVSDLCRGVYALMQSDLQGPVNIGSDEIVSVDQLVSMAAEAAGKKIRIEYVPGPVGVLARYHTTDRIKSTGWRAKYGLRDGLECTYPWILEQVRSAGLLE
jgi:nucleoside-diphosphate-sugar epimerase